jgi:hypothetical protein
VYLSACAAVCRAAELSEARDSLDAAYREKLSDLSRWCQDRQLEDQARIVASWLPTREPTKLYLYLPNGQILLADDLNSAPGALAESHRRFAALRREQARELWELARQAVDAGHLSLAGELAGETLREDPGHAGARRVLGYEAVDGNWQTAFAKQQVERGFVWHERFGWLPRDSVAQYEAGMRRYDGRWIDAREDARRRQRIEHGWRIDTDHYRVTTNHSLEEGVHLALQLERFYQLWRQIFASYSLGEKEFEELFSTSRDPAPPRRPHAINYYRTRAEYNTALRADQPRIEMTLGIYFDRYRRAYFFAGDDQHTGTLFHEATHQLFQETRTVARQLARRNNFWIIEGIATYMESLTEHDGYWTLGGPDAGRLPAARQRLIIDGFYVPLAELTRMGVDDMQQHAELRKLYSQAAGLAAFLMHCDGGRYRDALLDYLVAVYTGRADPNTLAQLTGTSYEDLDRQYREFLL